MRKALLLLLVLAAFVAGCENKYKDPDPQAMGYDYFPLEKGQYRVYQVTDTRYIDKVPSTRMFQLRERVDTSFIDQTGQKVYKLVRSIRNNQNSTWQDDSVMTVAKTGNMVVLTKDNTRFIKLVFPVKNGLEFIGDLFNSRQVIEGAGSIVRNNKEVYTYEKVGESYDLGNQIYPVTATVLQNFFSNGIKEDERFEVYAEGIGMIHRVFRGLTYEACKTTDCDTFLAKIESGHEREEILIDYGKL